MSDSSYDDIFDYDPNEEEQEENSTPKRRHRNYDEPEEDEEYAAESSEAEESPKEKIPRETLMQIVKRAQQEDKQAQFLLSGLYALGEDLPRDIAKMYYWLHEAARQGHSGAYDALHVAFKTDPDTPRNIREAKLRVEQSEISVDHLRFEAECGDAYALTSLGELCLSNSASRDERQAWEYFRQAESICAPRRALYGLGCLSMSGGPDIPQDFSQARNYMMRAAQDGLIEAQHTLGCMYCEGQGGPTDYVQGVRMLTRAAEQNYIPSCQYLALLYKNGKGVQSDPEKAVALLTKAARYGDRDSQYQLSLAYSQGYGVETDEAQSQKWLRTAAENGHPEALQRLQKLSHTSPAPEPSPTVEIVSSETTALAELEKLCSSSSDQAERRRLLHAQETGEASAACHLGWIYERQREWAQAYSWYSRAANLGDTKAKYNLAVFCYMGRGQAQNWPQAVSLYKQAAQEGHAQAQYNLSIMYARGQGTDRDLSQAFYWCSQAAEQGLAPAQYMLGMFYNSDEAVPRDADKMRNWLEKAAQQGYSRAQERLRSL